MITPKYSEFFQQLAQNNHTDWFHAHKGDYEQYVKKPFIELLGELIPELLTMEPEISSDPKKALFRINRDIRFSADKSPYNTIMKAGFSAGGKKSELPGFYLGIDADTIHVGGGLFMVKGPALKEVRQLIADKTDEFVSIVHSPSFEKTFGELLGDRAKRVDKAHQPILEKTPYIANKQFYAMQKIPIAPYYESFELREVILRVFREIHPLNTFLKQAL